VHLKTLTVRGFKSFAAATTFRLEPGITCVVGPNGSGKSNVVDAIAWVLGEQGAKALRGGSMSDVIFAGTPNRPPLGRAEVTLTIDNTDGELAVEYTEVSISRLMYRSGESEYFLNGTPCRLLDVQELMSDSGIGRELHVIVGQGQLDSVLQARPDDRRAFIEEAAGVLKHRKRKEKALRKLDAMQVNLARLTDLTAELRRQLGPLGRQAEVARKASTIAAAVRDARLRLLADDLQALRTAEAAEQVQEKSALDRQAASGAELAEARAAEALLEAKVANAAPDLARAEETYYRLAGLRERSHGLGQLATERATHLATPLDPPTGSDPLELAAEAACARAAEQTTARVLAGDRERLALGVNRRRDAEEELSTAEQVSVAAERAAADRREGIARLSGQLAAAQSRQAAGEAESGRLAVALAAAASRAENAQAELATLQAGADQLDAGELGLDEQHEVAARALVELDDQLATLIATEREHERERAAASARGEGLALSLDRRDGAGALLAAPVPGVLGSVAALLRIEAGAEAAIAAALGPCADAVAVRSPHDAAAAICWLRDDDAGRSGLLVGGATGVDTARGPAPVGRWALDLVVVPPELAGAVARALDGVVLVDDLAAAEQAISTEPELRAVTRSGDLLGQHWASGGSPAAPSQLEMRAAADEAMHRAEVASAAADATRIKIENVGVERCSAVDIVDRTLVALNESDASMAAFAERLALLAAQSRSFAEEAERLDRQQQEARLAHEGHRAELFMLQKRLTAAVDEPAHSVGADPVHREQLAATLDQVRNQELDARLAVRTGEERLRAHAGRVEQLESAVALARATRERRAADISRRDAAAAMSGAIAAGAARLLDVVNASLVEAQEAKTVAATARTVAEGELLTARELVRRVSTQFEQLRDAAHRDEVIRTEQRLRIESLQTRVIEEYGVAPEQLLSDYGPTRDVPPDGDGSPEAVASPYDRAVQSKRATAAERQLALLGRVNPLALEEFDALTERHAFLGAQLEDLKNTRRDLLGIVKEVDDHIHEVFRLAYEDTAREFEIVFGILFPGGTGRLELTSPDDLMTTGIEVIARPAGKKVSRLSLLSGGERSLAAIALLVAIFRARPSPFYILDEVEAALDDRNLQRLLECLAALRERSQLIIITHQKRTMEVADALYGVSMRDDGVSTVISQRLREAATA